jgi:CRP-like cAMP-binding protein
MINSEAIRSVVILTHLSDAMIEKVAALAAIMTVKKGVYVFKEGDYAENLYSVLEGTITLEVENQPGSPVRVKDIVQNKTFGISALVDSDPRTCISHALAVNDCKLVYWNAAQLEKLFYQDTALGFMFMKRIVTILKDRLQIKNAQMALHA